MGKIYKNPKTYPIPDLDLLTYLFGERCATRRGTRHISDIHDLNRLGTLNRAAGERAAQRRRDAERVAEQGRPAPPARGVRLRSPPALPRRRQRAERGRRRALLDGAARLP